MKKTVENAAMSYLPRVKIAQISAYTPQRVVSSAEIESMINAKKKMVPSGTIQRLFGIKERRFAKEGEQVSDLAAKAAHDIVESVGRNQIDCMIFAAACSDLVEPATANIVQEKLGLSCPVFDLKNACNSFVNAIQTATALIQVGQYKNVLITCGENLHQAIKFELSGRLEILKRLAAFSLGDAGAAALLTTSDDSSGIVYQRFKSAGQHWRLCQLPGGGSMYPRDVSKTYFEGKTTKLRKVIIEEAGSILDDCLEEIGWSVDDIKCCFMHQVSTETFNVVSKRYRIPLDKFKIVVSDYGNTAAASIPLAMFEAVKNNELQKGDRVLIIGLAAGISVALQFLIW